MYYKFKTFTDKNRQQGRPIQVNEIDKFYEYVNEQIQKDCIKQEEKNVVSLSVSTEKTWVKNARPFFNVNNDILDTLSHTNLNINVSFLNGIHNPICINFQENNEFKLLSGDNDIYEAKYILLGVYDNETDNTIVANCNVFFGNENFTLTRTFNPLIVLSKNGIIENATHILEDDFFGQDFFIEKDVCEKIIRTVFGVVLMSKNAYLLPSYDGLNPLVNIFSSMNKRRAKAAKQSAKKAEISKSNSLQLFSNYISTISNDNKYRGELKYQHYRTEHLAKRWVGHGNNKHLETVIVKATIVRKDLPRKIAI